MPCTDIASGTRVSLTYTEEPQCGVSPVGLNTDVTGMEVAASSGGLAVFTRPSGSFLDDGYLPEQWIEASGFADAATNGNWVIQAVDALTVTVYDPDGVIVAEGAGGGLTVRLTMATLRATARQLDLQIDTLESEEVRPSRQYADVRHGFNQVAGSPGFELSNASYTDMIRGAMSGDWVTPVIGTPGTVTLTVDDPSAGISTFTRTTGSWVDQGFRPGEMIQVVDGTNPTNDGLYRVLAVDALTLQIDSSFVTTPLVPGTTGVVSYPGARIDIGLTLRTFTMERRFDDIIQYQAFRGCAVNAMNLTVTPDSIAGGTFDILGMIGEDMTPTSAIDGNVPVPAPTTAPFAAFQGRVYEDGIPIAVMTSMEMTLDNQRTLEGVIGSKFSPGVFEGRCSINGSMTFFLRGNTTYTKFVNETETSVWMRLQDPNDANHFMNLVMPRVKFTDGTIDPPQEGPVPLSMGFRSLEKEVAAIGGGTLPTSLTIQSNPLRQ